MASVQIKITSTTSLIQVSIDDNVILKVNHDYDNTITVELEDGKVHILTWFVHGAEGSTYSIEVLSPVHVGPETGTLDDSLKDTGYLKIDLT